VHDKHTAGFRKLTVMRWAPSSQKDFVLCTSWHIPKKPATMGNSWNPTKLHDWKMCQYNTTRSSLELMYISLKCKQGPIKKSENHMYLPTSGQLRTQCTDSLRLCSCPPDHKREPHIQTPSLSPQHHIQFLALSPQTACSSTTCKEQEKSMPNSS